MRFECDIWELTDAWGNTYVMHSTAAKDKAGSVASVKKLSLPVGFSVKEKSLIEPLLVAPRMIDGVCRHTIVRDDQDNSYHQITFNGTKQAPAQVGCP